MTGISRKSRPIRRDFFVGYMVVHGHHHLNRVGTLNVPTWVPLAGRLTLPRYSSSRSRTGSRLPSIKNLAFCSIVALNAFLAR